MLIVKDFGMTFLILLIIGKLLKNHNSIFRMMIASIMSSLITLEMVIYDLEQSFWCKILLAFLTIIMAFSYDSFSHLLQRSTALFFISFLVGGIAKSNLKTGYEVFILAILMCFSLAKWKHYYETTKWIARNLYHLEFQVLNQNIQLKAFLDTGNFLTYGILEEPVMIVSCDAVKDIIPQSLKELLVGGKIEETKNIFLKDVCAFQYEVLKECGKETYGLKIRDIRVGMNQTTILPEAVMILTKQKWKGYDALIGLSVLEGGMCDGNIASIKAESKKILC